MKYILGIDLGTQSVKAGLLNLADMTMSHVVSREYPGAALQDSGVLWNGTADAVREIVDSAGNASIEGVGLSGQMHGTVLYDKTGSVIGPVINWQDERGNEPLEIFNGATAVEHINDLIPPDDFNDLGIDVMASGFLGATLFHIKKTDPETFETVSRVTLPTDFIRRKLLDGGEYATDSTNAFSTGLFNTRKNRWHSSVIEKLGLDKDILPSVHNTEEIAGVVGKIASEQTGLTEGIPVVYGGGDNQMAIIGSGVFEAGAPILINIGTSGQVCAVVDEYEKIPGIDTRSFIHGLYVLVGAGLTGGMAYTWLRDVILNDIHELGLEFDDRTKMFSLMDRLAREISPDCNGLTFSPLLRGSRRNPDTRASFSGVSMENFTIGHRALAVMTGVVEELLAFYKKFPSLSADRVIGAGNGLVKSEIWPEITTRTFGLPLYVTDFENAVYGAALVAAEGLNLASVKDGRFNYAKSFKPDK